MKFTKSTGIWPSYMALIMLFADSTIEKWTTEEKNNALKGLKSIRYSMETSWKWASKSMGQLFLLWMQVLISLHAHFLQRVESNCMAPAKLLELMYLFSLSSEIRIYDRCWDAVKKRIDLEVVHITTFLSLHFACIVLSVVTLCRLHQYHTGENFWHWAVFQDTTIRFYWIF